MALIEVTSRELRNKAEELGNLNSSFGARKSELETKEGELSSMWEGEAKNLFHMAFIRDKEQMDIFIELINKYIEALLIIAQRYEDAERFNAQLASERKY